MRFKRWLHETSTSTADVAGFARPFGMVRRMKKWPTKPITMKLENTQHVRQLLDAADLRLPKDAAAAIQKFVGHEPMSRDKEEHEFGIMDEGDLEDAYSNNPSPKGKIIRQQLEQAFRPVKAELQKMFGNTVPLTRYQREFKGGNRNVLSWTLNPKFAEHLAGINKYKLIQQKDIDKAVNDIENKGQAQWGSYIYRVDPDHEGAIDLYRAADDFGDEQYITGYSNGEVGPLMKQIMLDLKHDLEELHKGEQAKYKNILSRNVPLDQIVWATDRASQMEFIVSNTKAQSS